MAAEVSAAYFAQDGVKIFVWSGQGRLQNEPKLVKDYVFLVVSFDF